MINKRQFICNEASAPVRVNITTKVNLASIRQEKRNGRDVIIVPSATLPDDVIMNGIKYPAAEIEKSYRTLDKTPAPFGHPKVNGLFVSAKDPEGLNVSWIGAWNENVRRENGRVFLDKIIDVQKAKQSPEGQQVLNAIEQKQPIHTSTGLLCNLTGPDGDDHEYTATDILFDHDAILLNEDGAATPEQGVGIFVNSKGESEETKVINSAFDRADDEMDWAIDSLARALEKRDRAPMLERMKSAILSAFSGTERETSANRKEAEMAVTEEQFKTLSDKVDTLSESLTPEKLGEAIGNALKPITDKLEAVENAQKAKDDAELKELQDKIVKANLMKEDAAKELTLNAARALAETIKPQKAAAVNGAFQRPNDGPAFVLPKAEKEA
ncbi:hypothetical protein FF098_014780 [Parvularcula flava]|uniref:DUF2213 domain-containing protein n=1 Tax=Aquisalinus luteolus TaxID=1566827 RepID=A0A8J3A4W4_9PROT|nr:hypothetical protein [Aquisalinus luteolus]NHK29183.1 hypothetical protein [Aquisalinus luteolus]GGI00048.1 DUF2213 domain-containing protein [Aquisalinus luteolus]